MRYEEIPVEKASVDEEVKLRFEYRTEDLEEDIKKNGQLEPVLAYEKAGKYFVFVGMRRYFAIKNLYTAYSEPSKIRAIVFDREPSPEEKIRFVFSENENRQDLNVYEKIAFVLKHLPQADAIVSSAGFSRKLVYSVRSILTGVTVERLRRWHDIEMALGGVKLRLGHILYVSRLPENEQDFALFFIRAFDISDSSLNRINLKLFVRNTPLPQDLRKKMKDLGLVNPYGVQESAEPEARTFVVQRSELKEGQHESASYEKSFQEEEETLLFESKVKSLAEGMRVYILYIDAEPEIIKKKVINDEIVEIEGRKYRIRALW